MGEAAYEEKQLEERRKERKEAREKREKRLKEDEKKGGA